MRPIGIALAGAGALSLAALRAGAATVEVKVGGMGLDPTVGAPVIRLVEKADRGRDLNIWIGPFEAQAIAMEIEGVPPSRPLTHDLMKQLVERLGGKLHHVVIEDMRDNTYFATVHLEARDGNGLTIDARPSDAIALALRFRGPILVEDKLFAKARAVVPESPATGESARLWGLTVQDLTPDLADFFRVPARHGVVVSDVETSSAAHDVVRGDVITALDGEPVGSVQELAVRADARDAAVPIRLSVRRAGKKLDVRFSER
jgi:bifunctional DNase/RNase